MADGIGAGLLDRRPTRRYLAELQQRNPERYKLSRKRANVEWSVIVPTFGRPGQLAECLQGLAHQTCAPARYEVIVVDDGSPDAVGNDLGKRFPGLELSVLRQDNRGPAAARNHGAQGAHGRWLVFTDDDCVPPSNWLATLVRELEAHPDCVIGGRTVNGLKENLFSQMSQMITDAVYRHYNRDPDRAVFFSSNNLALAKHLFTDLGGFDETFRISEDRELCDRARARGHRLVYARECVVEHRHHLSFRSFCRQHFSYGKGAFHFFLAQRKQRSKCHLTRPGFHCSIRNWFFHPFTTVPVRVWPKLIALLFMWQMLNTAGFGAAAAEHVLLRPHRHQ